MPAKIVRYAHWTRNKLLAFAGGVRHHMEITEAHKKIYQSIDQGDFNTFKEALIENPDLVDVPSVGFGGWICQAAEEARLKW